MKHIYLRSNYLLTSNSVPLNNGLNPERLSATRTYHTALQSNMSSGSSCRPINRGLGSIPGEYMWDLWWAKWQWDNFSPRISVSHSQCNSGAPKLPSFT